jgi:hypothetical protein
VSDEFVRQLEPKLRDIFLSLTTPEKIQEYLDSFPYTGEELNRSPLRVMRDQQSHCLDGGLMGAAALRQIGYPAVIIDLTPEPDADDDHVLALFKYKGLIGAVAKSNFVGLRYREPVYRSLRELAMSYFEVFYNVKGQKTLRGYTRPMDLSQFDRYGWEWSEAGVEKINQRLYSLKSIPLISAENAAMLKPVDRRSYEAGMQGTNYAGLYKV